MKFPYAGDVLKLGDLSKHDISHPVICAHSNIPGLISRDVFSSKSAQVLAWTYLDLHIPAVKSTNEHNLLKSTSPCFD